MDYWIKDFKLSVSNNNQRRSRHWWLSTNFFLLWGMIKNVFFLQIVPRRGQSLQHFLIDVLRGNIGILDSGFGGRCIILFLIIPGHIGIGIFLVHGHP